MHPKVSPRAIYHRRRITRCTTNDVSLVARRMTNETRVARGVHNRCLLDGKCSGSDCEGKHGRRRSPAAAGKMLNRRWKWRDCPRGVSGLQGRIFEAINVSDILSMAFLPARPESRSVSTETMPKAILLNPYHTIPLKNPYQTFHTPARSPYGSCIHVVMVRCAGKICVA